MLFQLFGQDRLQLDQAHHCACRLLSGTGIDVKEGLGLGLVLLIRSEPLAHPLHGDRFEAMVTPVGIEQIIRDHGVDIGRGQCHANPMKSEERRFEVMHHFGSLWIVKKGHDRSHIRVDVDRDEGGVAATREGEPSQVGMHAWLSGEETVHRKRSLLR